MSSLDLLRSRVTAEIDVIVGSMAQPNAADFKYLQHDRSVRIKVLDRVLEWIDQMAIPADEARTRSASLAELLDEITAAAFASGSASVGDARLANERLSDATRARMEIHQRIDDLRNGRS